MESATLGCLLAVIVYASGSCLPRDDNVMNQEFFKSVHWKPNIVLNGTRIEKVLLNFSWKKKTDIDYSGVLYEIIKDRKSSPFVRNDKKSLSKGERRICTSGINDYRKKQLTFDDFRLFCFRECASWCDGTFCSDVFGQDQLEDKNVLEVTIEAEWGVEYYLRLEGYYNFSVSLHTLSDSAAAVFCLNEMMVNKQMDRSLAEDVCRGTEYFGEIYSIGPPTNLSLENVFYDYQKTVAVATFTWEDPLDIAENARVSWFLADTQYPPICDDDEYELEKIMATGGQYSQEIELSFGETGSFYVVACCDSCTTKTKTGFVSEFKFHMQDVDICKPEHGVPYCDENSVCFPSNSTPTICPCFQGYVGNGIREIYNGTGCHISCSNRNTLNHTCSSNADCEDDENGDAVCFCPGFSFGDGLQLGSGCISIITSICLPILGVMAACFILVFVLKRRRRHMEDKIRMSKFIEKLGAGNRNEEPGVKMDLGLFGQWEISRNDVTLHDVLGRGVSGVVQKATLRRKGEEMTVAVKTVPEGQAENMFLGEISLITTIGRHDNVLGAIGCCTSGYPLLLITEFMQYGDLQHFLWDAREPKKAETDQIYKLSEADVYKIGRQVASGMTHLSHLKIIHGDLAARNILVGKDLHCKISDFGLANDVYRYGMIQGAIEKKVPYKWISPERMMKGKVPITWRSDVWSCGVLLYETVTLGGEPYPGVKQEDLFSKLSDGYRMERPASCGETLFKIMSQCWEWTPSKRPSFKELESLLTPPKDKHVYINLLGEDANEKLMKN